MPDWVNAVGVVSLVAAGVCALVIIFDILRGNRQHMWIMNIVWPVTALYSGPLGLYAYFRVGRLSTHARMAEAKRAGKKPAAKQKPFWQMAGLGATHCGSGCTLGDIVAEWFLFFVPLTLFGRKIFAGWALSYLLAYLFGVAFQYFTIKPMRGMGVKDGIVAAVKADTLSLTAWQVGMYGWMAIITFLIVGHEVEKTTPAFWFMMQIAMLFGFATSYPVNWWLIRKGIKEKM